MEQQRGAPAGTGSGFRSGVDAAYAALLTWMELNLAAAGWSRSQKPLSESEREPVALALREQLRDFGGGSEQ